MKDLNVRPETIQRRNIGSNIFDIGNWIFFLDMPLR